MISAGAVAALFVVGLAMLGGTFGMLFVASVAKPKVRRVDEPAASQAIAVAAPASTRAAPWSEPRLVAREVTVTREVYR